MTQPPNFITLDKWRELGSVLDIDGHQIFALSAGQGQPLLCLHGFPTASFDYSRLVPLLADSFQVILFDFLGFGFSDKPLRHDYSLQEQARIARAVLAHFGAKSAMVLAHDMGDSVALELLRQGNPHIKALALLNGSLLLEHYRPVPLQRLLLNPLTGRALSALGLINRKTFGHQLSKVFAAPPAEEELDDLWTLISHQGGQRIYHRLIRYFRERKLYERDWLRALSAHSGPLTLVWGQRDPVSVPQIADDIARLRPDTTYVRLDDVGHYPHWEAPNRVAASVAATVLPANKNSPVIGH